MNWDCKVRSGGGQACSGFALDSGEDRLAWSRENIKQALGVAEAAGGDWQANETTPVSQYTRQG